MLPQHAFHWMLLPQEDYLFQRGGALPRYSNLVTTNLNNKRPRSWIGRGMSAAWPAQSPKFNPSRFCFRLPYYIKDIFTPIGIMKMIKAKLVLRCIKSVEKTWLTFRIIMNCGILYIQSRWGPIKTLWISNISLCYSLVHCKSLSMDLQILCEPCLYVLHAVWNPLYVSYISCIVSKAPELFNYSYQIPFDIFQSPPFSFQLLSFLHFLSFNQHFSQFIQLQFFCCYLPNVCFLMQQ